MKTIAVIGAFDTKGAELLHLRDLIVARGQAVTTIDLGITPHSHAVDIPAVEAARSAGVDLGELARRGDRGAAVTAMTEGSRRLVPRLFAEGRFHGIIGMGGSAGTAMATAAMRELPLFVPKIMISTMAGGDVKGYVGCKDVVMIPSIVDISGLNRISRRLLAQGAAAVCAMTEAADAVPHAVSDADKRLVCASMFGNTTDCVEAARKRIEAAGYEVLVFHATGTGGRTMESLIESGMITGVFDATTTEWADELVGGVLAAGPTRLEAAARNGVPAVIAPGCLDMVNFHAPETIPLRFQGRRFYPHNPSVTLMRTTPEECAALGRILAEKVNLSTGPVAVFLPLGGVSVISREGGPFHWPEADAALFGAIRSHLRPDIPCIESPAHINDPAFAAAMAARLMEFMG